MMLWCDNIHLHRKSYKADFAKFYRHWNSTDASSFQNIGQTNLTSVSWWWSYTAVWLWDLHQLYHHPSSAGIHSTVHVSPRPFLPVPWSHPAGHYCYPLMQAFNVKTTAVIGKDSWINFYRGMDWQQGRYYTQSLKKAFKNYKHYTRSIIPAMCFTLNRHRIIHSHMSFQKRHNIFPLKLFGPVQCCPAIRCF